MQFSLNTTFALILLLASISVHAAAIPYPGNTELTASTQHERSVKSWFEKLGKTIKHAFAGRKRSEIDFPSSISAISTPRDMEEDTSLGNQHETDVGINPSIQLERSPLENPSWIDRPGSSRDKGSTHHHNSRESDNDNNDDLSSIQNERSPLANPSWIDRPESSRDKGSTHHHNSRESDNDDDDDESSSVQVERSPLQDPSHFDKPTKGKGNHHERTPGRNQAHGPTYTGNKHTHNKERDETPPSGSLLLDPEIADAGEAGVEERDGGELVEASFEA